MLKPSFSVVTGVVAALVAIGMVSQPLRSRIPPPPPNALASSDAEFLLQASTQRINWRTLTEEAFTEARRRDVPVMLVAGAPWSRFGREYDRRVFSSPEVQTYMNRHFVCIRVDTIEKPEWINGFLPFRRLQIGFRPGFQIWIMDPNGRIFDFIGRINPNQGADPTEFLDSMLETRTRFQRLGRPGGEAAGAYQREELAILRANPGLSPSYSEYGDLLEQSIHPRYGGFPTRGFQILRGSAWRYLATTDRLGAFSASLDPMLLSPMTDPVSGGFFRLSTRSNWSQVEVDRISQGDAETMSALALGSALVDDPFYAAVAMQAFDSLFTLMSRGGLVAACLPGDERAGERSSRFSLSPRRLRELLPDDEDREWVRDNLGLRVETNPQMLPYFVHRKVVFDSRYARIAEVLREARPPAQDDLVGLAQLNINGYVGARAIETARMLGDSDRLRQALGLVGRLESLRAGDDVWHGLRGKDRDHAYLGDYLGYAEAALQAYLVTGEPERLRRGLAVLLRAHFLFRGEVPGEILMSKPRNSTLWPQGADVPEVVDNLIESGSARAMRLSHAYGRLLQAIPGSGRTAPPEAAQLAQFAVASSMQYARLASEGGVGTAGLMLAMAEVADPGYAIAVGPDSLRLAAETFRLAPTRLVAPAGEMVKPELRDRPPGVYVFLDLQPVGPMTPAKAAQALGAHLRPDVGP